MRSPAGVLAAAAFALTAALASSATAPAAADAQQRERVLRIADPRITESSGLATSATLPGVLWTVNDSGGGPQVFGIGPSGLTVVTVTVTGAANRDWEAVAVGPRSRGRSWLWVGDIGDNLSQWPSVRVYRVAEPTARGDRTARATGYDLVYPDGPRDAEALLVDPVDGRLYVVSKRVQGAAVYQAPATLRTDRLNRLVKVTGAPPLVTDGSFAPDGRVALRDYLQAWVAAGITGRRHRVTLPLQPQGESLTWTRDGSALLAGSEGERSEVWRVPVAAPVATSGSAEPTQSPGVFEPAGAGAADGGSGTSPWLVVGAGLLVGAGAALVVRRSRQRRER